jgi:hypothetical protein
MPPHPDRVRKNYIWTCPQCFEKFISKEELDKHIKDNTSIIDWIDGPVISNMHWSGNYKK